MLPSRPASPRHRIEPIASERYKLQLTIDATTKSRLETARDLLRHSEPSGDFALVLSRALDLLIADLLRHRFGAGARRNPIRKKTPPSEKVSTEAVTTSATPPVSPASSPAYIPRAIRRAVLERDGLACTWVDANGNRCNSRAWLELDHRRPRAKGGSSDVENIRFLCRAHNHLAAERAYGRAHMERAKSNATRSNGAGPR